MGFASKFTEQAFRVLSGITPQLLVQAAEKNPWFIPAFVQHRLDSLKESLTGEKETLEQLLELETQSGAPQVLSIVAAGNIPLVCWHDLVCCLAYAAACPNKTTVEIKLSSKDDVLLPVIVERLAAQEGPCLEGISVQFVDRVSLQTQAILFTGGAQAQEHYCRTFPGIPLLLRTGRSSVALVTGAESAAQLRGLAEDCFLYFGLGCRNVSLLLVPSGYDFGSFIRQVGIRFGSLLQQHNGYMNAFRHARACRAMTTITADEIYKSELFVLQENDSLFPPMAVLHYMEYKDLATATHFISANRDRIQCVAGTDQVPFGQTQAPLFTDYADGLNTLEWLQKLSY